ncbi:MAG: YigZ family protein [Clostridia bacterium]|nr:YigZ family protein [Clostridia bacterium]MCL6520781.1 YigZ family protein [Bacillota bacterium]
MARGVRDEAPRTGGAATRRVVTGEASGELDVKRSRFVARLAPAVTPAEARGFWLELRRRLPDARHHAVAWRVEEAGRLSEHASDDGEPAGTAGRPILAALRQHGLEQAVLVVSRHFGGILLGAPGLVRAYRQAAELAIARAPLVRLVARPAWELEVSYALWEPLQALARRAGATLESPRYGERVRSLLLLPPVGGEALLERLREMGPPPPALRPLGSLWRPEPGDVPPQPVSSG